MSRISRQRVVDLALEVLDRAAYASRTHRVDNAEVRLALAVLWFFVKDRRPLHAYWQRAGNVSGHPWDTCRPHLYAIAAALREAGWDAAT